MIVCFTGTIRSCFFPTVILFCEGSSMSNKSEKSASKDYGDLDPRGWPKWLSVNVGCVATAIACAIISTVWTLIIWAIGCFLYWLYLNIKHLIKKRRKPRE